ncbi:MAG: hypothetical protein NT007_01570 [Candidatus Kapabacteria bacterium]|nr:hypothetical protein [Candidatus Kapabacteria bacterium]
MAEKCGFLHSRLCENFNFLSFLSMQESPSSPTLGDSCIRRNDRNEAFETALLG